MLGSRGNMIRSEHHKDETNAMTQATKFTTPYGMYNRSLFQYINDKQMVQVYNVLLQTMGQL